MEADEKERLPEEELLAQMNTFIFAAKVRLRIFLSFAFPPLIFWMRPDP
jgi:hypothetical protein